MDHAEYIDAARRAYQANDYQAYRRLDDYATNSDNLERLARWDRPFGQGNVNAQMTSQGAYGGPVTNEQINGQVMPRQFHPQQNATLADLQKLRDRFKPTMMEAMDREQEQRLQQQQYQQTLQQQQYPPAQSEYEDPDYRVDRSVHAELRRPYFDKRLGYVVY